MTKYRKKPVVVEAIRNRGGDNASEVAEFFGEDKDNRFGYKDGVWSILTLEGTREARLLDWIIKGVKDEFYPCKPDIFEQTYELVENLEK